MSKLLVSFAFICGFVVVLFALFIALASASASMANGVANAAASTTLLTSQCTSTLLIVIAFASGSILGAGLARLQCHSPYHSASKWLPGPNDHWQQLDMPSLHQRPAQHLPVERSAGLLADDADEDSNLALQGWGFWQ